MCALEWLNIPQRGNLCVNEVVVRSSKDESTFEKVKKRKCHERKIVSGCF